MVHNRIDRAEATQAEHTSTLASYTSVLASHTSILASHTSTLASTQPCLSGCRTDSTISTPTSRMTSSSPPCTMQRPAIQRISTSFDIYKGRGEASVRMVSGIVRAGTSRRMRWLDEDSSTDTEVILSPSRLPDRPKSHEEAVIRYPMRALRALASRL